MSKTFRVDFFYNQNGVQNRMSLQGNAGIQLNNMTSDFAVMSWLQNKYGHDVIINRIEWR